METTKRLVSKFTDSQGQSGKPKRLTEQPEIQLVSAGLVERMEVYIMAGLIALIAIDFSVLNIILMIIDLIDR